MVTRFIIATQFICFAINYNCFAQQPNYENMSLKEFFDAKIDEKRDTLNQVLVYPASPTSYTDFANGKGRQKLYNTTGADDMAEVVAPVMDAQLELYETTMDKGYLINFINDALQMVSMRADYMQARLGTYKYKNV